MSVLPRRLADDGRAELVDHLGELRSRLVVCAAALAVGTLLAYLDRDQLIGLLNAPLDGRRPITLGVTEPFATSLKVSICGGVALAFPVCLWQLWAFAAPAIGRGHRRTMSVLVAFASVLFGLGVTFAYWQVLGPAVSFLTGFDSHLYDVQIRAAEYYSFALMTLIFVGLVFELPIVILGCVRLRVLSADRLRRSRRIGYVAMVALAVALPGIDPVTTSLEAIPLLVLFEISIWLAVVLERKWLSADTQARSTS